MAERKKPQTEFVPDSSEADDTVLAWRVMPDNHFATVIKFARNGSIDQVKGLTVAVETHIKKLELTGTGTAVSVTPEGSDQVDVRSIIEWMEQITKRDRKAVVQLLNLAATLNARLK